MRQNRPGTMAVGIRIPVGRMDPAQMEELARLAECYGNSELRLTMTQNAIIPNVPDEQLDALLDESLLQEFTPRPSPFRRSVIACTGTDYCNLAQIDTKRHAEELSTALEENLGTTSDALSFHWSGCPAACGNHQAADVGFRGMKAKVNGELIEAVAIYVNGRMGPAAAAGQQIVEIVPCDRNLVHTVAQVIQGLDRYVKAPGVAEDVDSTPVETSGEAGAGAE
jgi:ferredoxin-nitrite reductase